MAKSKSQLIKDNLLRTALRKVKRVSPHQVGGYLTPSEYFAVLEEYKNQLKPDSYYSRMEEMLQKGISGGMWVYFQVPNRKVAEQFEKSKYFYRP